MNPQNAETYMKIALLEACKALEEGEVPVGAVLVKDGEIIAQGHNRREAQHDISSHAEIEVLKEAGQKLGTWSLEGCSLYVTLEPCLMCAGAIEQARISTLVYGADDKAEGAVTSKRAIFDSNAGPILIYRGVLKEECAGLLKSFFLAKRASK